MKSRPILEYESISSDEAYLYSLCVAVVAGLIVAANVYPPFSFYHFVPRNDISMGFPFAFMTEGGYVYCKNFSNSGVLVDIFVDMVACYFIACMLWRRKHVKRSNRKKRVAS